ncbi:MAG: hypothetical protein E7445_10115 [Ruminococcaceae bacterium]|nr:hypothetical protein [Oscillospiraceae bacterium]
MRVTKRVLSLLLAMVMVVGLLPTTVFATGEDQVYISVSYDGQYIDDRNGDPMAYIPVPFDELASVDLEAYGLGEYLYDENGDGTPETTALQLVIYAHENIYGGSWSDVTFTGAPGSSYFEGGIFGFDENLNYYLNGQYPLAGAGWGATSDQIVLEAGDFIDLASFSSWDFYQDSAYGFHFFADADGNITHAYTAEAGTVCDVKLILGTKDYEYNSVFADVADYEIFYGTALYDAAGTVTTDESGCAEITFPTAGTWYLWVDGGYGNEYPDAIVSAPGYAQVTVTAKAEEPQPDEPEQPAEALDVSEVLEATMEKLASTVTAPAFGTDAGEWTVFSLARGNYFAKDNAYFTDYYSRIVETVNAEAAAVDMNGALHKNKSTENSRLIVALSALGKDATSVGNWDLVEAYSANGLEWIKKQGMNGTLWALIALDSNDYATTDTTIRQQCVDAIVAAQHDDGGWALQANTSYASDPDITGMALTALYPYRDQSAVAAACEEAFACLSEMQHDNGTFASGGSECAESCAWVIVATTTWGIHPDTDSRFVKNGSSVVDALLTHYLEDEAQFEHIIGAGANNMATDQACYALVAYDRFVNGKTSLYDYSDVTFEDLSVGGMRAALGVPEKITNMVGTAFNGVITISNWDNAAEHKLIDFIVSVPDCLGVTDVKPGSGLNGGAVRYHLEEDTAKLRIVYFDAEENNSITHNGTETEREFFTIVFRQEKAVNNGQKMEIAITGMSVKNSSYSLDEDSQVIVNTDEAKGTVEAAGLSFCAVCLYEGDGVDQIPKDKKAVAVAVTGIEEQSELIFRDGSNEIAFLYSAEITEKTGVGSYVALVDSAISMEMFVDAKNYATTKVFADELTFGDVNGDGVVNAQDALAAVDAWLRKGEAPDDDGILRLNVNGDSRINTFDALGIVEHFVNGSEYAVVTKAATLATKKD